MIKHTLEISDRAAHISLKNRQLIIKFNDSERCFPCEDIAVLILQNPAITITAATLNSLCEFGAAIVICGSNRLPSGLLLPLPTHTQLVPRMMAQLETPRSFAKQAWKQIIQAKIKAQAKNLDSIFSDKLEYMATKVRSGDPENFEAQASKIYWQNLFCRQYRDGDQRNPQGKSAFNSMLNYGYAIIRASVARAVVSAGLIPALGVFHKRRDNPFCLADDLMEPLRPAVDRIVYERLKSPSYNSKEPLDKTTKGTLLELLSTKTKLGKKEGPLMVILPRYINNYFRFITNESKKIEIPIL